MVNQILYDASTFRHEIAYFKSKAPMYPEIYFEERGGSQWATTMVRFEYNGVAYKRHHVESIIPTKTMTTKDLYDRLNDAAEMCIKMAIPCSYDEIIGVIEMN